RHAVAFLFLDVPPDEVDVNVHPTKSEVRFRNGHALYGLVFGSVRERLSAENLTARLRPTSTLEAPQPAPAVHEPLPWYDPRVASAFPSPPAAQPSHPPGPP